MSNNYNNRNKNFKNTQSVVSVKKTSPSWTTVIIVMAIMSAALFSAVGWGLQRAEENAMAKAKAQVMWQIKLDGCFSQTGLMPEFDCLL